VADFVLNRNCLGALTPFVSGVSEDQGHAARGTEREAFRRQRDRRTNDASRRIRHQSKKRKRIEESFGWLETIALMRDAAPRDSQGGVGVHLCGGGLQSGADAESAGQPGWCRMRHRRSVPACGESGQKEPQIQSLTLSAVRCGAVYLQFGIVRVADFSKTHRFSASCWASMDDFSRLERIPKLSTNPVTFSVACDERRFARSGCAASGVTTRQSTP
jgi:hypothetical protein